MRQDIWLRRCALSLGAALVLAGAVSAVAGATPVNAGAGAGAGAPARASAEVGHARAVATAPAGAATPALPNPCSLAPASLVAPALGVAPSALHGTLQKSMQDGFHIVECVFRHGAGATATLVTVTLAPQAYGQSSAGGIPGLVTTHPSGLGPEGRFLYDTRPGDRLASAIFVKDGMWGDAFSNAHVPPPNDLALGRYAYAHLA